MRATEGRTSKVKILKTVGERFPGSSGRLSMRWAASDPRNLMPGDQQRQLASLIDLQTALVRYSSLVQNNGLSRPRYSDKKPPRNVFHSIVQSTLEGISLPVCMSHIYLWKGRMLESACGQLGDSALRCVALETCPDMQEMGAGEQSNPLLDIDC